MKRLIAFLLLLFHAAMGWVLLATESGLKFIVMCAEKLYPEYVNIEDISGSVWNGITLHNGKIVLPDCDLHIDSLAASWQLEKIFQKTVHINTVTARGLRYIAKKSDTKKTTAADHQNFSTQLPVSLQIDSFLFEQINLAGLREGQPIAIDTLSGSLSVRDDRIEVKKVILAAQEFGGTLDGKVGEGATSTSGLHGTWRFSGEDLPQLSGEFDVAGQLSTPNVHLHLALPIDAKLDGSLNLAGAEPAWDAHLQAEKLSLPQINAAWPEMDVSLDARMNGVMAQYQGDISAEIFHKEAGTVAVQTRIQGNEHQLEVSNLTAAGDMGKVSCDNGLLNWQDGLSWQADVQLADFDPGYFATEYPGSIHLGLKSEGSLQGGRFDTLLNLESLAGQLRGYPLAGSGKIVVQDKKITAENLELSSGKSKLQLNGSIDDNVHLTVEAFSSDLGELVQAGSGSLKVKAEIAGTPDVPSIAGECDVHALKMMNVAIADLHARLAGGFSATQQFSGEIKGSKLSYGTKTLDSFAFSTKGTLAEHSADLSVSAPAAKGAIGISAGYQDGKWTGAIRQLQADSAGYGSWKLADKAAFSLAQDTSSLAAFCLDSASGRVCLKEGSVDKNKNWKFNLESTSLNLETLLPGLGLKKDASGKKEARNTVNVSLALAGDTTRIQKGKGLVQLSSGQMNGLSTVPGWENFQVEQAICSINLAGEHLAGEIKGVVNEHHQIHGQIEVGKVGSFSPNFQEMAVKGAVKVHLNDINFVGPLTQYDVQPTGSVDGEFFIGGTVAHPELTGDLHMPEGAIDLTAFGVTLSQIRAKTKLENNLLHITAHVRSGPGELNGVGTLGYSENRGVFGAFQLTGESVDIFHRPEYDIRADPNIRFSFDSQGGEISGHVFIPHAVLTPEHMKSSVSLSEDVIFVDGSRREKVAGWQFATALDVELGKDVRFDGYGLTGLLGGKLDVIKKAGGLMRGKGELALTEGKFSIYGRILDIVRGRVIFNEGPIDDPEIDARTQKMVSSESSGTREYTVGVDVNGTVKALQFRLYSEPYMEQSDILAFLVVGQSISSTSNQEKNLLSSAANMLGLNKGADLIDGITNLLPVDEFFFEGGSSEKSNNSTDAMSFVVGKRLTDRLFVGYDHNFVEQKGEFKMRYTLGHGFTLETRSSGTATGGDLFYSFEK